MSPGQGAQVAGFSLLGTLQLWDGAKDELRFDEMRACLHDGAIVETVASEWLPLAADEAVEAIRTALRRDPFYLEGAWSYDELAPEIVLTVMPVRERSSSGGVHHLNVQRLTSGSGGLIWRQKLFRSREEAVDCLAGKGVTLGL
jgi:hypothetical protein